MADAYIYDAVRTPRGKGKSNGSLHEQTSLALATQVLQALRDRNNLDTSKVDDVYLGCVTPIGEQGSDIARSAVLNANYSESTAGVQIDRFCASGLEAVNIAAAKVKSGEADMAIGGGVEAMSRVPMGSNGGAMATDPSFSMPHYFVPQGIGADMIASKWGFSRTDVDAFAVESQKRAAAAWKEARFKKSIVPVKDQIGITLLDHDEHMRPETTMQSLASLNPSFTKVGEDFGFDAVVMQRYPEVERIAHVHHAARLPERLRERLRPRYHRRRRVQLRQRLLLRRRPLHRRRRVVTALLHLRRQLRLPRFCLLQRRALPQQRHALQRRHR